MIQRVPASYSDKLPIFYIAAFDGPLPHLPTELSANMPQVLSADFDVEELLAKLSMKAKITLLCGKGWWHTEPVPEVGIPSMRMSDGKDIYGTSLLCD